jgi:KDO2-lipid IV(A) lauroyltransferase
VIAAMERAGVAQPRAVADAMYHSLGWGVFELLWISLRSPTKPAELVEVGPEVRSVLGRGGAVLATAHTGNWDLVACGVAAVTPLTVVTKHLSVGWLDAFWQSLRARRGVHLVSRGQVTRAARDALAARQAVALIIDQAPERTRAVVTAPFLNELAEIDLAPALIAMRARVPLLLVVAERTPRGTHRARLLDSIEPPARPSRKWAEAAMQRVTAELEEHVKAHPEQWLWMHRRWKRSAGARRAEGTLQTHASG